MTLSPGWRKLTLTVHLTVSVGWIGAVASYLALGASAVTAPDDETLRAAWIAMEVTGWYAIARSGGVLALVLGSPLQPIDTD